MRGHTSACNTERYGDGKEPSPALAAVLARVCAVSSPLGIPSCRELLPQRSSTGSGR